LRGSDGNVGIGTPPSYKLDIASSTSNTLRLLSTATSISAGTLLNQIIFENSDDSGGIDGNFYIKNTAVDGFAATSLDFQYDRNGTLQSLLKLADLGPTGREVVINEDSVDCDFRVESDTNTHAFFLEGSSGNVGIGTSSPSAFDQVGSDDLVVGDGTTGHGITIYSGTGSSGSIAFADGTTTTDQYRGRIQYAHTDDSMRLFTSSTERLRITSSGYLRLSSSSGGIQFNGDTAAANALDDYEEGTWTPALYDAGNSGATSITVETCQYVKIGKLVTVYGSFTNDGDILDVGDWIVLSGLPFTPVNTNNAQFPGSGTQALPGASYGLRVRQFSVIAADGNTLVNLHCIYANSTKLSSTIPVAFQISYYVS
jgi:hypothetical protein